MIRGQALTTGLAAGLVVGVALSGCGARSTDPDASRAARASVARSAPVVTPGGVSVLPEPPAVQSLPSRCASMLSAEELGTILGRRLSGVTQFVRGVAEPSIRRTGRVTCRYGVATGHPARHGPPSRTSSAGPLSSPAATTSPEADTTSDDVVPIEIGLSAYRDPDSASQRIDFTVRDQQAKGAKATDATLLGVTGVLLTGANTSMLTLSYGTLTLALSIDPRVVPPSQTGRVAAAIGKTVLRHLSGGTGASG